MPSLADYSLLLDLMDVKRLYEEQQEKWNMRIAEKEEQLQNLMQDIAWRREQAGGDASAGDEEIARLEEERTRISAEAETRIQQLNQRLAELTQKVGS